jgi:hypothetical protein
MIISLLISLHLPTSMDLQHWLQPVTSARGFKILYDRYVPSASSFDLTYKRTTDDQMLRIQVGKAETQNGIDFTQALLAHPAGATNLEKAPSNVPFGDYCFVLLNGLSINAAADGFYVRVDIPSILHNSDADQDVRAIESLARVTIAESIGSVLHDDGTPMAEKSTAREHTHRSYAVLTNVAKANAFTPTIGDWGDRCTIEFNKHKLEFALGSDTVSVDGKLSTMEAFVARKNGVWIIPKKILGQVGMKLNYTLSLER